MTTHMNIVAHKRMRGEKLSRNTVRDERRDAVMRTVFAQPGFAAKIAKHLGLTHQNISAWNRVPSHHVMKLAPLLGLSPEQIRPDVFGKKKNRP
jgi:hypothetical protein